MSNGRLRVIVLGWLIREPTGGQAWHALNYVHGLAALGHDVYYIEDSGDTSMCYGPDMRRPTNDATYGLRFAANAFSRLGLGDRWAYYDAHTNEWKGARASDARGLCKSADLMLHVSAFHSLRDWLERIPIRVMIDTDPGFTQIRNLTDPLFHQRCEGHTAFFSFGENFGKQCCAIPRDGFPWRPTRQPMSLAAWPYTPGPRDGRYTTVMQWQSWQAPWEYKGLRLATKAESFRQFINLPARLGPIFEIAVRSRWTSPHAMLRQAGWGIADIDGISRDPWTYRAFIQGSKAEFGIAKAGYVETRCGWFSERSAAYLASGRPVLHQDTGFPDWLPCGKGVFAFRSPDEVIDAVSRIDADYDAHCRAARELAVDYFSTDRVLPLLIDAAITTPVASSVQRPLGTSIREKPGINGRKSL
jgi:hypothetical protein